MSTSSPNRPRYSIEHVTERKESRNVPMWRRRSLDREEESLDREEESADREEESASK